jgi:sugar lactone lactonase YvrE
MDWSADGRTFFFADSGSETVDAYAVDAVGAPTAAPPRRVAALPSGHAHVPDGLCLDAAGNLWVALGESGAVVCYSPTTGEELRRVALPVKRPTSCAFGGGAREVLYVTTRVEAGEGASAHHGGLFAVRVPGVRGAAGGFHEYAL